MDPASMRARGKPGRALTALGGRGDRGDEGEVMMLIMMVMIRVISGEDKRIDNCFRPPPPFTAGPRRPVSRRTWRRGSSSCRGSS
jgi:hypothetical protein